MDNTFDNLLDDNEKLMWAKIRSRLETKLQDLYAANLDQLDKSTPSGALHFTDPIHPKRVTTAPREIVINITAEISTSNKEHQLEDISRLFSHHYHIAVPPDTDYTQDLAKFVKNFDESVKDYATKFHMRTEHNA